MSIRTEAISPERFMAITRARCIARYRMQSVPGRPEELQRVAPPVSAIPRSGQPVGVQAILPRTISFGCRMGEIRIRKHGGHNDRAWIDHVDIRIQDGWLQQVYEFLDDWMGLVSPVTVASRPH